MNRLLMILLDIVKGTQVTKNYDFFMKSISFDRKHMLNLQLEKLKKIINHSYYSVPYYKQLFDSVGLHPSDIEIISDLNKVPILDRDVIQNKNNLLISDLFNKKKLHKGSSSGTTGIPIEYYSDNQGSSAGVASGYLLWSMSGWKMGQRNIHIWGNQSSIERWETPISKIKNFIINQKNIPSTRLSEMYALEELVNEIIKFKPVSIDGYSSSIYTLAKYFKENNFPKIKSLKQVITTAENLENYQKDLIEEIFAPTGDLYGSGEILGVAIRPARDDKYYVLDSHVVVEVTESGIPGMKDLLVTDLDIYGMPLIRYKIGDMIDDINEPTVNSKYPLSWFSKIHGRSSDIIELPNGMKFHPINIFGGTLFRKFPNITRHKVIWNGKKLIFIFESQEDVKSNMLEQEIKLLLEKYKVDFTVKYTNHIKPSVNGKYKYLEITNEENY